MTRKQLAVSAEEIQTADRPGGLYFASEKTNIEFIRSGCTMLDCVLGGGWAIGRVVNIVGDKSTGKTLLAMEAAANFLRDYEDGDVQYKECEAAFDEEYAAALGIPIDRIDLDRDGINTVEDLMRDVDTMIAEKTKEDRPPPTLYIIDSLDSISDESEMDKDVGKGDYGGKKAKLLSEFFRTRNKGLTAARVCLMVISQVRENLNAGLFGKKFLRSGGKALDFYCSQVMWLYNMGQIDVTLRKQKRVVGVKIKAKNDKNKVALPYRECAFTIRFGYGVEDVEASHAWLKEVGREMKPDAHPTVVRDHVFKAWFEIEQAVLPKTRKYQ